MIYVKEYAELSHLGRGSFQGISVVTNIHVENHLAFSSTSYVETVIIKWPGLTAFTQWL